MTNFWKKFLGVKDNDSVNEKQQVVGNPDFTTPPPQPENKGEDNFNEGEDTVAEENNSRAGQKYKGAKVDANPYDYTKSVFKTGVEKSFYDKDTKSEFWDDEFGANNTDASKNKPVATTQADDVNDTEATKKEESDYEKALKTYLDVTDRQIAEAQARLDKLSGEYDEDDESRKNREKRERNARLIAGLGDAANAFHQAYAYARGVKPMTENKSISDKTEQRIREAQAWRNKNRDSVDSYRKYIAELQNKKLSALQAARKFESDRALKEAEQERKNRATDAQIEAIKFKNDTQEALAELYRLKAKLLEAGDERQAQKVQAEIDEIKSRTDKNKASTAKTNKEADMVGADVVETTIDSHGRKSQKIKSYGNASSNSGGGKNNSATGSLLPQNGSGTGSLLPNKK